MPWIRTTAAYVRARFGELRTREQGITAVEYALMVAVVALLLVGGFVLLFNSVKAKFSSTATCISGPVNTSGTGC